MFGVHIYRLGGDGALILDSANAAADRILKVRHCFLLGKRLEDAFPAFCTQDLPDRCRQVLTTGGEFSVGNIAYAHAEGEAILNLSAFSIAPDLMTLAFHDVAAHKRVEDERAQLLALLIQAQKLEHMGRLAGGVVHDFNNLLHGIMAQMEILRDELESGHPVHAHLEEITSEAKRSARLLKQLLSFVSQQEVAPQCLEINGAVANMIKLLRRLLGVEIELVWKPDAAAGAVHMDPSQFDQILTNLVVNARDAIHGVGRLTIETQRVTLDKPHASVPAAAGSPEYVRLTLRDTGCGMDEETQARIFEPFFTTKPNGQNSGLGLATVQRIIQENHGWITVQSTRGQGSAFEIYLPWHGVDAKACGSAVQMPLVGGNETVLLVEDEKIIRVTTCRMLQKLGYTVLMAESPEEALRLVAEHTSPIHLLLTDVVLPGMTGHDLALKLTKAFPAIKCLFMSGHPADVVATRGLLAADLHFIAKPFSRESFAIKLRDVLGSKVAA